MISNMCKYIAPKNKRQLNSHLKISRLIIKTLRIHLYNKMIMKNKKTGKIIRYHLRREKRISMRTYCILIKIRLLFLRKKLKMNVQKVTKLMLMNNWLDKSGSKNHLNL